MNRGRRATKSGVHRRHVLFFGGFDPKGASWYHALYQRHAALQAAVNGMQIEVGRRQRDADGNPFWRVRGSAGDAPACETRFEVVSWDPVVRRHWSRSGMRVAAQLLAAYLRYLRYALRGVVDTARQARGTFYALGYPLGLFLAGVLASLVGGVALAFAASELGAPTWLSLLLGVAPFAAGCALLLRYEQRVQSSLLARIVAFVSRYAVGRVPELDDAIAGAARRIAAILRAGDCDELLVVGYSVGSILATRAVAQALADAGEEGATGPALALLTLGHCIPMLGSFRQAGEYRAELAAIAASDRLHWVDVSAPGDWASFPLLDPLAFLRIEPPRRGRGSPRMTSPRFHKLIEPARYARMIRDKHAIHTLYLMSTDRSGVYDWFAITAGAQPLSERYAGAGEAPVRRARGGRR